MTFDCKFLNLPKIPDELVANIKPGELIRDYPGREYTRNGVKKMSAASPFYHASTELKQWINDNICNDYNDMGIRYSYGSVESPTTVVHTDETRSHVLIYNIDNGQGHLSFWQEQGQPVVRDGRYTVNNYDQLTLLKSVETPDYQWYLIDARILHSVEDLQSTRINVQISLNYNLYEQLSVSQ